MRKFGCNLWGEVGGLGLKEQLLWLFSMTASSLTSQVLRLMVGVQVTDEQLESITDRTVQEADEDGDGAVSFLEFAKSLEKMNIEQKMSIRILK